MDAATRSVGGRTRRMCLRRCAARPTSAQAGRADGAIGGSLPFVCQDWANTKGADRFFSNDRVSEARILAGPFQSTRDRFAATEGTVLVVQDTTEFPFQRESAEAVGIPYRVNSGKDKAGRFRRHTVCGLLRQASLVVTTEGLPLGLSAGKVWSRQPFKGTAALKRKINPMRVPIEQKESIRWLENLRPSGVLLGGPARCVHVGDRESDSYELFCTAQERGTSSSEAGSTGWPATAPTRLPRSWTRVQGLHAVDVHDSKGRVGRAIVELRYGRVRVLPPIGKPKRSPALTLTVIHAKEHVVPADRPAIDWKLITDLPVSSCEAAIEKLRWDALRWTIEVFPNILRSGCRAEEARLRPAERRVKRIAVFCLLSWRVFWMTMINRAAPHADPRLALTTGEIAILDRLVPDREQPGMTLSSDLTKLARLGGSRARTRDPPPGNIVMWRGLSRLTDIAIGAALAPDTLKWG
jgi:transposase-like protein